MCGRRGRSAHPRTHAPPDPAATRAAHPLLHRLRRRPHRLRDERHGPAAREARQLDHAPGVRLGEPRVAALAARALARPHAAALRRARLRALRPRRRRSLVRVVGARPRDGGGRVGLERFPLLGLSQGCAVAVAYAVRHPERVSPARALRRLRAGHRRARAHAARSARRRSCSRASMPSLAGAATIPRSASSSPRASCPRARRSRCAGSAS